MDSIDLPLYHLVRRPAAETYRPPLLILLHDNCGDENDLAGLASAVDPRFVVLSPRAPFTGVAHSYTWFPPSLTPPASPDQPPETEQCCHLLLFFIKEAVRAYRVDPTQVYLFGFSQGAILALSALVTEPEILAGVVAVSGQIPGNIHSLPMPNERLEDFPVMVAHGIHDDLYPIEQGRALRDILSALLVDLTYREYKTSHQLSSDILSDVMTWLAYRLALHGESRPVTRLFIRPPFSARLAHTSIRVRNLDRSIAFYARYLGLYLVERAGNAFAFLSSHDCPGHHELSLENVGSDAAGTPRNGAGLNHLAFEVPDQLSFARAYKSMIDAGVRVRTTDHIICWSMYFRDPDRNGIELFWDTRHIPGRSHLWQGRDQPLPPEDILAVLEENQTQKG